MLSKWAESVRADPKKDAVGMLLLKEIEKYRKCLPYLKFVRGDGWERNHWNQLFALLKMPTKGPSAVSVESLTVDHFLDAADALAANGDAVKHLHAQAQGEVTLREAIRQLEMWGLERVFTLHLQVRNSPYKKWCEGGKNYQRLVVVQVSKLQIPTMAAKR
eukprot:773800-Pyramimonas_sp.AAC.2